MIRLASLLLLVIGVAGAARAEERILDFHSDIVVAADASMRVTETIRVRAEGGHIQHGIYRDFPTEYRDGGGNRVHVDFEPLSVTRDGAKEPFHTEPLGNGVRVYFGSKETVLRPGEYSYALEYRTTRQLGFFADHDELYWNVTGNGWDFVIETASATVALPGEVPPSQIHVEGYTGAQGLRGTSYRARADAPSHALFSTTRPLSPREGLTIVVAFPKGIVTAPTFGDSVRWFLGDNAGVLVGVVGLLVVLGYYLWQWNRVGRDPKPGVIIPQYQAPDGFSPGALRHVERMKYDDRCFAADVVDLAVRGALNIRKDGKTFVLERADRAAGALPSVEAALLRATLGSSGRLELKQANHATISSALKQHEAQLKSMNSPRYFSTNSSLMFPGIVLCLVALFAALFAQGRSGVLAGAGFILLWLSVWSLGVAALVGGAIRAWRGAQGVFGYIAAIGVSLFALPFIGGEVFAIGAFVLMAGIGLGVVAFVLIITNFAFFEWLKAPTVEGRRLLDRIAGLRLYLGVAERDELARLKAPPMSLEEFQKFLPYALALGVEKTWADRFAAAVGPAAAAAAATAMTWYHGGSHSLSDISSLTGSLGSSLSGAISSSSSAPGSSSGSGGGGSSGGGGGGGGGGGW